MRRPTAAGGTGPLPAAPFTVTTVAAQGGNRSAAARTPLTRGVTNGASNITVTGPDQPIMCSPSRSRHHS
jgi:hypothetical protein